MVKKHKVGTVQMKKDGTGFTVAVGSPNSKSEQYKTNVEIIVRDGKGVVLGRAINGFLKIEDPRKRTNKDGSPLTEDQLAKIPDWIKNELYLITDEA